MSAGTRAARPGARRSGILAALVIAIVIPPLTSSQMPDLVSGTGWLLAQQAVALAIAALSLNLLLGYAGQISLGHAGLLAAGAFTSGLLTSRAELTLWWGLLAAPVVAAGLAFLIGLPALRLKGLYLALVTVVFVLVMQNSVLRSSFLGGGSAGLPLPRRAWGDQLLTEDRTSVYLTVCLVCLVLVWVVDENIKRSRIGRAFAIIKEDEAVAQSFGISVVRYKLLAFVVSGAMAGLAGALYGHAIGFVNNETFGLLPSLLLITMVMVGGAGHRLAVMVMAMLFVVFPFFLPQVEGWEVVIGGVILMLTVARHPEGMADLLAHGRARPRAGHVEDVRALPMLPAPPARTGGALVPPGSPLLEVRDVRVQFGGLKAVDGAGFTVHQGRIVGLIGPNGAGKSTLFNAVTGLVPTVGGEVHFAGRPIHHLPTDRRAQLGIARSFQYLGLARDLTVHGNLMLAQHQLAAYPDTAALLRVGKVGALEAELSEAADRALETLDFLRFRDRPVKTLSGGQQRIVEIAALLLTAPELVMLDEPTAGMAPGVTENLAERLRALRDEFGRTVLIIEHNIPLVLDTCDEVYVLDAGKVIAHGDPHEIVRDREVVAAYFGSRGQR